jgi:hypothetical protein
MCMCVHTSHAPTRAYTRLHVRTGPAVPPRWLKGGGRWPSSPAPRWRIQSRSICVCCSMHARLHACCAAPRMLQRGCNSAPCVLLHACSMRAAPSMRGHNSQTRRPCSPAPSHAPHPLVPPSREGAEEQCGSSSCGIPAARSRARTLSRGPVRPAIYNIHCSCAGPSRTTQCASLYAVPLRCPPHSVLFLSGPSKYKIRIQAAVPLLRTTTSFRVRLKGAAGP